MTVAAANCIIMAVAEHVTMAAAECVIMTAAVYFTMAAADHVTYLSMKSQARSIT